MQERVLALAHADARISGGAVTGSAVAGGEDRWSDIDLSFGVADGVDPEVVLTDWTELLTDELGVLHHWDLRRGATIYRVFLLPGGLELDIAVTPAGEFGAHGPSFRLLFGKSVEHPPAAPASRRALTVAVEVFLAEVREVAPELAELLEAPLRATAGS